MEPCGGGCQRNGTEERSRTATTTTPTPPRPPPPPPGTGTGGGGGGGGPKKHTKPCYPLSPPHLPSPPLEHPATAYDTTWYRQKACRVLLIRPSPRQAQGASIDTNKRFAPRVLLLTHHNTSNLVTCHGWWWERLGLASISVTCSGGGGMWGLVYRRGGGEGLALAPGD